MKTFNDLQIGDFIYEITKYSKTVKIGQIREISASAKFDWINYVKFSLDTIIGNDLPPFIFLPKSFIDDYKFENSVVIIFVNESDFLKYLSAINENI